MLTTGSFEQYVKSMGVKIAMLNVFHRKLDLQGINSFHINTDLLNSYIGLNRDALDIIELTRAHLEGSQTNENDYSYPVGNFIAFMVLAHFLQAMDKGFIKVDLNELVQLSMQEMEIEPQYINDENIRKWKKVVMLFLLHGNVLNAHPAIVENQLLLNRITFFKHYYYHVMFAAVSEVEKNTQAEEFYELHRNAPIRLMDFIERLRLTLVC